MSDDRISSVSVSYTRTDAAVRASVSGDLDRANHQLLVDLLVSPAVVAEVRPVLVDLAAVPFIDSVGVAALLHARSELHDLGATLTWAMNRRWCVKSCP